MSGFLWRMSPSGCSSIDIGDESSPAFKQLILLLIGILLVGMLSNCGCNGEDCCFSLTKVMELFFRVVALRWMAVVTTALSIGWGEEEEEEIYLISSSLCCCYSSCRVSLFYSYYSILTIGLAIIDGRMRRLLVLCFQSEVCKLALPLLSDSNDRRKEKSFVSSNIFLSLSRYLFRTL